MPKIIRKDAVLLCVASKYRKITEARGELELERPEDGHALYYEDIRPKPL